MIEIEIEEAPPGSTSSPDPAYGHLQGKGEVCRAVLQEAAQVTVIDLRKVSP